LLRWFVAIADGVGEELRRVPVAGGAPVDVGPLTSRRIYLRAPDLLVWWEDRAGSPSQLVTAPLANLADRKVLAEAPVSDEPLVLDQTHAYYATSEPQSVRRMPLAGGTPQVLVANQTTNGATIREGTFYWIGWPSSNLQRIPVAGGTPEVLTEVHHGGAVAADANGVYWGDSSLNAVERWSQSTGRVQLTRAEPNDIVVADGAIYWTERTAYSETAVARITTSGESKTYLLCGMDDPGRLFVEGKYLIVATDEGIIRLER
jgi:hypothetical protein